MNVDWVIPCRYLEVHDNLGTLVGAGIDTFWLEEIPQDLQVLCAVRLLGTADELHEDVVHHMRSTVTSPDGEVVSEIEGELALGMHDARETWLNSVIVPMSVMFTAERYGSYQLEHTVDGSSSTLPLHVAEKPGE